MENINKNWIDAPRNVEEYIKGVEVFLDFAFQNSTMDVEEDDEPEILCPCTKCANRFWFTREVVFDHLIAHKFNKRYKVWSFHGEGLTAGSSSRDGGQCDNQNTYDNMEGMVNDIFRDVIGSSQFEAKEICKGPNSRAKKFYRLLEDARKELYPGCKDFSVLSYTVHLYLMKCESGWSDSSFDKLMKFQCAAFPFAKLPTSFYRAKKMVKNLGLGYKQIDACPNDCMLYWKEHENDKSCYICGAFRWKLNEKQKEDGVLPDDGKPVKVLRYFPVKPRLQRLFMCSKTADLMTWHENGRKKDENLRHPADGQAWKDFDTMHPEFAREFRNVRLGLTTDGFNPFRTMSVSHSIWPVVLSVYNLPPWLYNKSEYNIMSLIIPGPSSPGYDIDVYLQPLIEELKDLWEVGIDTYDAVKDETFSLRAALLWTISDFPAYAMLSGWSTKGKFACPSCNHKTWSKYLKYSKKMCYMGNRCFLNENHPWRCNKRAFDGEVETRPPPSKLSGMDVLKDLEGFENKFGKKQKKGRKNFPWKKKSIFFELPYWKTNTLRHNLDVMHIEKNICDSVLNTLLDIPGKTKDHLAARFDLLDMGIRKELHPKRTENRGKRSYSKACFSMSPQEKDLFCNVIKCAKFPDGCASNISRCVQSKEKKITGYKSHDAHFMLHYLLPVAGKNTLSKQVASALIRLGSFFRGLCKKVLKPKDLDDLECEIKEILCLLEKIFPPSFFDIMIHLSVHLVDEARLGGPVQGRWMYPKERYLGKLKSYVKNKAHPEGSIAEAYLAEECLVFCSRYLHDDFSRQSRYDDDTASPEDTSLFPKVGCPLGIKKKSKGKRVLLDEDTWTKAHRYVLFNCDQNNDYIREHQDLVNSQRYQQRRGKRSKWVKAQNHSHDIGAWFKDRVQHENVSNEIKALSRGPDYTVRRFKGYVINGHKFHTIAHDSKRKTQCSGVSLTSSTSSFASSRDQNPIVGDVRYYGAVEDIIELDYFGHFTMVLFRCKWFQIEQDEYGLTRANFRRICYSNDPFVMANQVSQVFYVQDSIEKHWHYVMETFPRDLFDMSEESQVDIGVSYWNESAATDSVPPKTSFDDNDVSWLRDDLPATTVDVPEHFLHTQVQPEIADSDDEIEDDTLWDFMHAREEQFEEI